MDDSGLKKNENNEYEVEENFENNNDNPVMVLTIDIGNGKIEQFKLYNFENPKKDIYDFCMKNNLDYNTMEEISKQLNELITKKVNEEEMNNKKDRNKFLLSNNHSTDGNSYINKLKKRNNNFSRDKYSNKNFGNRQSRDYAYSIRKEKSNVSKNLFPYQLDSKQNFNYNITNFQKINSKSLKTKKNSITNKRLNPKSLENNIFDNHKVSINNNNLNLSEAEILLNSEIIKINNQQYGLSNSNNSKRNIRPALSNNNITSKKTNHNSIEESIKAGNNLYTRGLKYQEDGNKKLEKLKSSLIEKEGKTSTFHPELNKSNMNEKNRIPCTDSERIIKYKEYYEEKIKRLKEKKQNEEENNYTFQPKVNKDKGYYNNNKTNNTNKKNMNNTNNNKPKNKSNNQIFAKLYEDSNIYKENLNKLDKKVNKMYSYRPILNDNSKIKEPFDKRLLTYHEKSKEKMKKIKDEIDKENFFKPKYSNRTLTKDKISNQNSKNENNDNNENNPYTLMYLYKDKYKQNKKQLELQTYSNYFSDPIINKSTDKLLENKKERAFKKIFSLLDGDEDNLIKNSAVNINKIPKNIKEILEPIFRELKEENETLDENEFITVCDQIYKSLPYDKKNILMNFAYDKKNNYKKQNIYSYKPKINSYNGIKSRGLTLVDLTNVSRTNNYYSNNFRKQSNSNTSNYLIQ